MLRVDVMRRFDPHLSPSAGYRRRHPASSVVMDDRSTKAHGTDADTAGCIEQGLVHNLDFTVFLHWPYRSCDVVSVAAGGSTLRVLLSIEHEDGSSSGVTLLYSRQHWAYRQTVEFPEARGHKFGLDFPAQIIDQSAWRSDDGHRWELFDGLVTDMPLSPAMVGDGWGGSALHDRKPMLERYEQAYANVWADFALRVRDPAGWLAEQRGRAAEDAELQPHRLFRGSAPRTVAEWDDAVYGSYCETCRLVEAVCAAAGLRHGEGQ